MEKIMENIEKQLKLIGYEIEHTDIEDINYLIEKNVSQIKYLCAIDEIQEPLYYVIIDKVCAEFLKNKIALGQEIGTEISTNATNIKIGDVSVDFPENSSNEAKMNLILEKLERKDFNYSPYSKMRW